MTDHEADEADLALMQFADVMIALGISAPEAIRVASERIPELYVIASEAETLH